MSRVQPETVPYEVSAVQSEGDNSSLTRAAVGKKIWIDLDNSPHVPFFAPIIRALETRGHTVVVTAREFAQVTQLADLMHLRYKTIGRHYGKNKLLKMAGVAVRAAQLASIVRRIRPDLAVSHGSRAQLLLSSLLRVPSVNINDYEHATDFKVIRPSWMIVPELIPSSSWDIRGGRVLHYPGIKEDVYVPQFAPDPTVLTQLNVSESTLLVTLRPPASHAHYHNPESDAIFAAVVNWLVGKENVVTVILPRTAGQEVDIRRQWGTHFHSGKLIVPSQTFDGLQLIWHSDLVISGGGTMNREAAALHVPVYSTFRGKLGAIDQYLVTQKRLVLIESVADVSTRINLEKRDRHIEAFGNTATLTNIVDHITLILEREWRRA
jgi:hypothetical protein